MSDAPPAIATRDRERYVDQRSTWAVLSSRLLGRGWLFPVALGLLLAMLTAVPIIAVVIGSFRPTGLPLSPGWTLANYQVVWTAPRTYTVIGQSMLFAFGSTFFAVTIATFLAWLLERTDLPHKTLFRVAILVPMVTPPLLLAIGWVLLMSPQIGLLTGLLRFIVGDAVNTLNIYSLGGMVFVQGIAMAPTAFLLLAPMFRNMDPSLEESAYMSGATFGQTMRRVTFPLLTPALVSASMLLFLAGMLTFDIPSIIGLPARIYVMSSEIFTLLEPVIGAPAYGRVSALSSCLFILLAVLAFIYYRNTHEASRFATVTGKGFRPAVYSLGVWRLPAVCFVSLYLLMAVIAPMLAILWMSLMPYFTGFSLDMLGQVTIRHHLGLIANPRVMQAAFNSVVVAISAAVFVILLSFSVAWIIVRWRAASRRILDVLTLIPIGMPNIMVAVALIFVFISFRALPIYGSIWIIALAHAIIYLPFGSRSAQTALIQIDKQLEEAAYMSGASIIQTARYVLMRLIQPALIGIFVWVAAHSMREFSAAMTLRGAENAVLPTLVYSYWNQGRAMDAAAIAFWLMLLLGVVMVLAEWTASRRRIQAAPGG